MHLPRTWYLFVFSHQKCFSLFCNRGPDFREIELLIMWEHHHHHHQKRGLQHISPGVEVFLPVAVRFSPKIRTDPKNTPVAFTAYFNFVETLVMFPSSLLFVSVLTQRGGQFFLHHSRAVRSNSQKARSWFGSTVRV